MRRTSPPELVDPVFADPAAHSALEVLSPSTASPCSSSPTSPATPTWPSAWPCCSASGCPQNFDAPLTATSLREFWRRWTHDVLALVPRLRLPPLGGNRHGGAPWQVRNLLLTMLLAGLWHGGGWTVSSGARGDGRRRWPIERDPHRRAGGAGRRRLAGDVQRRVPSAGSSFGPVTWRDRRRAPRPGSRRSATAPLVTPLVLAVIAGVVAVQLVPRGCPRCSTWPSPGCRSRSRASASPRPLVDRRPGPRCRRHRQRSATLDGYVRARSVATGDEPPGDHHRPPHRPGPALWRPGRWRGGRHPPWCWPRCSTRRRCWTWPSASPSGSRVRSVALAVAEPLDDVARRSASTRPRELVDGWMGRGTHRATTATSSSPARPHPPRSPQAWRRRRRRAVGVGCPARHRRTGHHDRRPTTVAPTTSRRRPSW